MFTDDFDSETIADRYEGIGQSISDNWANTTSRDGHLRLISACGDSDSKQQLIIATAVISNHFSISTSLSFKPVTDQQKAGLITHLNPHQWYYLHLSGNFENDSKYLNISSFNNETETTHLTTPIEISNQETVQLKLSVEEDKVLFYYSLIKYQWHKLGASLSTKAVEFDQLKKTGKLSTAKRSIKVGMCLANYSKETIHADFDYFKYRSHH